MMQVLCDPQAMPAALAGSSLALGNFDGVHRGHQQVLGLALKAATKRGRPAGVMVFEPHPRSFFAPDRPFFQLTPLAEKLELFEALGLDMAVVLPFDATLANTEAEAFVADILHRRLRVGHVVAGFNFHFGKGRRGSPAFLREAGSQAGFEVTIAEPAADDGEPFSSSAIRASLEQGEVAQAARMLGYWWFMRGEVIAGERRGRTLGFPTANLAPPPACGLRHGIYAVRMRIGHDGHVGEGHVDEDHVGEVHDGVASFGVRPTFGGGAPLLETHLFDFSGDLYGRLVEVELIGFIRAEERFDTAGALIERMNADAAQARAMLASAAAAPPIGRLQTLREAILARA